METCPQMIRDDKFVDKNVKRLLPQVPFVHEGGQEHKCVEKRNGRYKRHPVELVETENALSENKKHQIGLTTH